MDYGDIENQQFADFINNQNSAVESILRNSLQRNSQIQQNIDWRMVLAAKDLIEDDRTYRLPIGFTCFSLFRIVFTLFALNYSKDRSQFIQIFTSIGLFKDLLTIFYNYMMFRYIQKLKKSLFSRIFDSNLVSFLNELQNKDISTKYKSSLVINCILKTSSFMRLFQRVLKCISWGLFFYSILMIAFTDLKFNISGISIPLIVAFTFSNYCVFVVMLVFFFYSSLNNTLLQFRSIFVYFQTKYIRYQASLLVERLPCSKYENISDKQNITSCAVCLVDYNPSDKVLQLKCSTQHHFHKQCIKQWLDIKPNCPICRTAIFDSVCQTTHHPSNTENNNIQTNQISISQNSNHSSPTNISTIITSNSQYSIQQNSLNFSQMNSSDEESITQQRENLQFIYDMKNQVPNKQIVEMIEENLANYNQIQVKQQNQMTQIVISSSSSLKET